MNNGSSNESYSFDSVGNRTASHRSNTYGYQPFNKIGSTQTATYGSDANGNMVQKSEGSNFWRYLWDGENRLTTVSTRRQTVRYVYDALGRRVRRHIAGSKENTKFTYDSEDVLLDDDAGTQTKYLNGSGIDNKVRSTNGSNVSYFLSDHLGSTNGFVNSSGALTASNSYDSFGNGTNSSFPSRYQFTGREADSFTGLQFSRARFYDPKLGRFISEDPIGFGGGINQYSYVSNNSINKTDPTGLYEIDVHYYLTYYLAMRTGCFSQGQAVAIGNADQMTDEDPDTAPGFNHRYANGKFHALNGDASPGVGSTSIGSPYPNFKEFGQQLHYYQDTFSHDGYHNNIYGHAKGGHYWDKTDSDVVRAIAMANGTWQMLLGFGQKLGCKCGSKWTPEMSATVESFSAYPSTPNAIESYIFEIYPEKLDYKRGILGMGSRY